MSQDPFFPFSHGAPSQAAQPVSTVSQSTPAKGRLDVAPSRDAASGIDMLFYFDSLILLWLRLIHAIVLDG